MRDTWSVPEFHQLPPLPPLLHVHMGASPCKGRVSQWAVPGVRETGSHWSWGLAEVRRRAGRGEKKLLQLERSYNYHVVELPDHFSPQTNKKLVAVLLWCCFNSFCILSRMGALTTSSGHLFQCLTTHSKESLSRIHP